MNDLLDRLERAEAELRQLRRENALLRSEIDPDVAVAEFLALGMNVARVSQFGVADLSADFGVPVC